jgi:hypothetical protein
LFEQDSLVVELKGKLVKERMASTTQHKAKTFVRAVLDLRESFEKADTAGGSSHPQILTSTTDDLARLVERILAKQDEYKTMGLCSLIDVGYHYTKTENLDAIRTHGLLTLQERTEKGISAHYNGSENGDGIYTCDEHKFYREQFGPVGLLVARLKGPTTGTGDVQIPGVSFVSGSRVVLRSSAQCIPLLHFTNTPDDQIFQYQSSIHSLIDLHFNAAIPTTTRVSIDKIIYYKVPEVLNDGAFEKITMITEETPLSSTNCAVCMYPLGVEELGQIQGCGHKFHFGCIIEATSYSIRCPLCNAAIVEPQGKMPSGTMTVRRRLDLNCEGYGLGAGTIQIDYALIGGVQKLYHR